MGFIGGGGGGGVTWRFLELDKIRDGEVVYIELELGICFRLAIGVCRGWLLQKSDL